MDNGWSRTVLEHQIGSDLYDRQGKAITNFQVKLPEPQSDLAEQTLKNPYNFDFLTLREEYDEKELEDALVNQITQFLLEQDNPTIGLLICKDKDDVVAEYALNDISQPIGIAAYELTKVLREEFKSSLPTIEKIENELAE